MTSKPDSDPIVPFSSPVFRMDDQSLADGVSRFKPKTFSRLREVLIRTGHDPLAEKFWPL